MERTRKTNEAKQSKGMKRHEEARKGQNINEMKRTERKEEKRKITTEKGNRKEKKIQRRK